MSAWTTVQDTDTLHQMKLKDLDFVRLTGTQPIRLALQWLETTLSVTGPFWDLWDKTQRAAAIEASNAARIHLDTDVRSIVAAPADDVTRLLGLNAAEPSNTATARAPE